MCQEYFYLWRCDHLTEDFIQCGRQPECRWNPKRNVVRQEMCPHCQQSRYVRPDRRNPNPGLRESFTSDLHRQQTYFDGIARAARDAETYRRQQRRLREEEALLINTPPRNLTQEQAFRLRFLYSVLREDVQGSRHLRGEDRHRLIQLASAVLDTPRATLHGPNGWHTTQQLAEDMNAYTEDVLPQLVLTPRQIDDRDTLARLIRGAANPPLEPSDGGDNIPAAADEFVPVGMPAEEQARRRRVIPNILTRVSTANCSICQEIQTNDAVRLPCSHDFCRDCITRWLATSNLCPNCRRDFGRDMR